MIFLEVIRSAIAIVASTNGTICGAHSEFCLFAARYSGESVVVDMAPFLIEAEGGMHQKFKTQK